MTDAAIETKGLRRVYRTGFFRRAVVALTGLDLRVPRGSTFGFIGPNGAGKTTTIKLLAGLSRPDGGSARIMGIDISERAARAQVGFLPERPYFYPHLKATEILELYGALVGLKAAEARRRSAALLDRVGLSEAADRRLGGFSKGMLQRIGMAQALIGDPQLVILDEPMSGLDPMGRALVRDIIGELKSAGKTVFFSSHILSDVEHLCDELALLDKGRLVTSGLIRELMGRNGGSVELVVSGLVGQPTGDNMNFEEVANRGRYRVFLASDSDSAQVLISAVMQAGGRVESLSSSHRSLEQIVVDVLHEDRQ